MWLDFHINIARNDQQQLTKWEATTCKRQLTAVAVRNTINEILAAISLPQLPPHSCTTGDYFSEMAAKFTFDLRTDSAHRINHLRKLPTTNKRRRQCIHISVRFVNYETRL